MKGDLHYYISALPALGELDSEPPLTPAQLQREAFLAGEIEDVSPVVLAPQQARNEAPLPPYLVATDPEASGALQGDRCWETCFRYTADVARRQASTFLAAWVGHEVALRNALAAARARRLGLEESDYLVAEDLADPDADFTPVLSEWTSAPTPLAGLRVLIAARWAWLSEHDAWFSFRDDELAAYAAKLLLLLQWRRVAEADEAGPANQTDQINQANESSGSLERTTP